MIARYVFLAFAYVILALIQFFLGWLFLAPVLVFCKSGYYPDIWIFRWAQPTDSPAIGDAMYGSREAAFTQKYWKWFARYIRGIMWGCRNPAYGFLDANGFTVDGAHNPTQDGADYIDIGYDDTGKCIKHLGSQTRTIEQNGLTYFSYRAAGAWGANYGWMVAFGYDVQPSMDQGSKRSLLVGVRPRISLVSAWHP